MLKSNPEYSEAAHPLLYTNAAAIAAKLIKRRGGMNVVGVANFPLKGQKTVATARHYELADPYALGLAPPRAMWPIGKQEMWGPQYGYVVGPAMALLNTIKIDRDSKVPKVALARALTVLANGGAVLDFLERTRKNKKPEIEAHQGVAWLAINASSVRLEELDTAQINDEELEAPPEPNLVSDYCSVTPIGISTELMTRGRPIQIVIGEQIMAQTTVSNKVTRGKLTDEVVTSVHDLTQEALKLHRDGAGEPYQITKHD